ncbi:hypothetical protein [Anaerosalibacter sp. Marseille-P3206]|uniref:hypothetical protein n=1 Tax=Anaerosalibacter sp. Marseille-P3206 TaxID=1871005 RepID=UPI0009878B58|nr:hypothetical protein [Anaerosalibacter sp. Marseille-P3206]
MVGMKKSIALFISFIITIVFISSISILFNPIFNKLSENQIKNIVLPITLSSGLMFFILFQATLKLKWNKKLLKQSEILVKLRGDNFTNLEKSWLYIFLALIYFSPILSNIPIKSISTNTIFPFIAFCIIISLLLKFSEKTINIIFTKKGIIITGLDLRVNIPLGQALRNATGYYPYSVITGFLPLENSIELFLQYEQGKIIVKAEGEVKNQILGILKANKIEIRKF